MIRHIRLDPNLTYPFVTRCGIKEMTPAQAESYAGRNMSDSQKLDELRERVEQLEKSNMFRVMVADRIRAMAAHSGNAVAGMNTMRWNGTKELLYVMVHGEFQCGEKERTKRAKYLPLDLTTFKYETLSDVDLLTIYEMVSRRLFVQM